MHDVTQIVIGVSGVVAMSLALSDIPRRRRLAPLIGLAGQPFWLVATATADQYGMFLLSAVYTGLWAIDAWRRWWH